MLHDLSIVVGQVATLFLLMSVGFVLAKTGWFSEKTISQMSHLLFYCVSPCIIIERLQIDGDVTFLISLGEAFLCMSSYYVMFLIIAQFLFRRQPEDKRVVYRFGTVFGNNSYMGLPLLEGVLGPSSVIYGVVAIITFNVFQWTVGVRMMGGKMSLKKCFINPGILSLAAGMILFLLRIRLPAPVGQAVSSIADLNTPLAMVIIGAQMSRADILGVFKMPLLYGAALIKMVVPPLVMIPLLLPFHLPPLVYCACVTLCACPTAGVTGIFAQMFGRDTEAGAQMVTLSTLLCIITLPLFAAAARQVAGLA